MMKMIVATKQTKDSVSDLATNQKNILYQFFGGRKWLFSRYFFGEPNLNRFDPRDKYSETPQEGTQS